MAVEESALGFFLYVLARLVRLATAETGPILVSRMSRFRACLLLAELTKIDDLGHPEPRMRYFLRKASSETTSALLPASVAAGATGLAAGGSALLCGSDLREPAAGTLAAGTSGLLSGA